MPSAKARSAVDRAEPPPHHEAMKVMDRAQNGRLRPAKK